MLCKNIGFDCEKVSWRLQLLSKTLYNLHFYIDAAHKKNMTFHACVCIYACRYSIAMSTRLCNVLLIDFVKKSRFECCFWSTQGIETKARTSDNIKTGFFLLSVHWWSFLENVVYFNILRSIKAEIFELEKAMFTSATLVPMFTIITPAPYTQSKQSKAIHAKCNLKVNCEKKWVR